MMRPSRCRTKLASPSAPHLGRCRLRSITCRSTSPKAPRWRRRSFLRSPSRTRLAQVAPAVKAAMSNADISMSAVDAIYASAHGAKRGERLGMRAIQRLFGDDVRPVFATKAYFGEYAAGGGLQFAAALLAIRD